MKRKLLSLILAVVMIFSCSFVTFAQEVDSESEDSIDRNTVITEKNIEKILKHYGLNFSTARKKQKSLDKKTITTVGELEDAINFIKQQPKQVTINDNDKPTTTNNTIIESAGIIVEGSTSLSYTRSVTSSWGLTHSVVGQYTKYPTYKEWNDAYNAYVLLDEPNPSLSLYSYSLDSIHYVTPSYTSSNVCVNSEVVVGTYVVVGIPPLDVEVHMSDTTVTTTKYWDTSYIP